MTILTSKEIDDLIFQSKNSKIVQALKELKKLRIENKKLKSKKSDKNKKYENWLHRKVYKDF